MTETFRKVFARTYIKNSTTLKISKTYFAFQNIKYTKQP